MKRDSCQFYEYFKPEDPTYVGTHVATPSYPEYHVCHKIGHNNKCDNCIKENPLIDIDIKKTCRDKFGTKQAFENVVSVVLSKYLAALEENKDPVFKIVLFVEKT